MGNIKWLFIIGLLLVGCTAKKHEETEFKGCNCDVDTCTQFDGAKTEIALRGEIVFKQYKILYGPTIYHPYIVKLYNKLCVKGNPLFSPEDPGYHDVEPVEEIQLAGQFDSKEAIQYLLKPATFYGYLFPAHTKYHVTPILMNLKRFELIRK